MNIKKNILVCILLLILASISYPQNQLIYLEKATYLLGETVTIQIIGPIENLTLEIDSPSNVYRYLGVPDNNLKFIPKQAGNYQIFANDMYGNQLENLTFTVIEEKPASQPQTRSVFPKFSIQNSVGDKLFPEINLFNQSGNIIFSAIGSTPLSLPRQKFDVDVSINRQSVRNIRFYNVSISDEFNLGFDELPEESVKLYWRTTDKVFAIDPTSINFDSATVTAIAKGHELFKCKEYNFTTKTCFGNYVKMMDLIPGESYNFTLTPEDPQYTELTTQTVSSSCTNTCTTAPGGTSQCTATCFNFSEVNFTTPVGAISGWLEKVSYNVTLTLGGTGTSVSGTHSVAIDKDKTVSNGNEVSIGSSSVSAKATYRIIFNNTNMPDPYVATSFDNQNCTWSLGYCTWKPYLSTSFTCSGSQKTCITTMSITWINYTWNYTADTINPSVVLVSPANNSFSNSRSNIFSYTPSDNLKIKNCSLFLNNIFNQSNLSVINDSQTTTFTASNMQDGKYSWFVRCIDTNNNTNTSGIRNMTVDATFPSLDFIIPTPGNDTYISANFLTINVSHSDANPDKLVLNWNKTLSTQTYSGSFTNITKSGLGDGIYYYNVSVNDSAANINYTGTRKITIDLTNPGVTLNDPQNNTWIRYNTSIVFNYTPSDTNIWNCSLYGNFSGVFLLNQTNTTPISGQKNMFSPLNISDGIYFWNVLCFDRVGRSSWASSNNTVKIDASLPVVTLRDPFNKSVYNLSSSVVFNYSVTDNLGLISNCSLELISNLSVQSFEDTTIQTSIVQNFTQTLSNNKYNWTVRCTDPAGNTNNLVPGYFNVTVSVTQDTVGPSISLDRPFNNNWTNINNLTLFYTPSDSSNIYNCSLYVNDLLNQTRFNLTNSVQSNFTVNRTNEGTYNWYVNCTDNSTAKNNAKSASVFNFTVDQTRPRISLSDPTNSTNISQNYYNFSWIALDNLDNPLLCDLMVNGTNLASNVLSQNNSLANQTYIFVDEGRYFWNITCIDEAFNANTSETRNFLADFKPPVVSLNSPINGNVSLSGNITFYFTPYDNVTGLNNCNLYVNSVLNQTRNSANLLNNQQNNFTINKTSSGNYSWQVNCTDLFGNLGSSALNSFSVDTGYPVTNSYSAYPAAVDLGQQVNITVNVTDNVAVSQVIARVTYPDGITIINYTMSPFSGDLYNLTFTNTIQRGSYKVNIIANDTNSLQSLSGDYYFFVVPGITINKVYYDRGETVNVIGGGFDSGDNITINITNAYQLMVSGFPDTILANSTGGFNYRWNITSSSGIATGNYTLLAYDTSSPDQSGRSRPYLVRKAARSILHDKNNANLDVTGTVNESEDSRATMVTSSAEDWTNFTWSNIVPSGQTLSDIRFFIEHIETSNNNLFIQWWNSTSSSWSDVCTIVADTANEDIDSCNLNSQVKTSAEANNIKLKVTDKSNYGASVGTWTNIDFTYLELTFTTLIIDKSSYQQGEQVNITGSRWPSNSQLTLNITKSDSQVDQQTVTTNVNGDFNTFYNVSYGAPLGSYSLIVYVTSNPADTDSKTFEVVKRNSSIITDKSYYGRGENINITGIGFSPLGNVTFLLYDAKNILRINESVIVDNYSNGTFQYNLTIPTGYPGYFGNHLLIASDRLYPNLNGSVNLTIGIITTNATKIQNAVVSDVTQMVNVSENLTAFITVYNAVEDLIRLNYKNVSTPNSVLSNLTFYIEHNESQNFDLVLEWWNESSWIDVCRISFLGSERFDSCDLLPLVQRSPRTSNLTLKITDNQTNFGTPGSNWTFIDFTYLVSWSDPDSQAPSILSILPVNGSVYNYSQQLVIRVNVTDNVMIDKVSAVINFSTNSQALSLSPLDVNFFGDGIYEGIFSSTQYLGEYNVTIYVNDTSGNANESGLLNFSVRAPDLMSNSSFMSLSNDTTIEGENISINLTIFNLGNINSGQFIIRFFDGNYSTGAQIGDNITVSGLIAGKNITVNTSWIATIGSHNIQTEIDSPASTNGSIIEMNESNNLINKQITTPAWNLFYGTATGKVKLEKATNEKTFLWNLSTGGNIYVVESNSNIGWLSLQSMGRNISNLTQFDDFHEADLSLMLENYTDSINRSFTSFNLPNLEANITIYTKRVNFVPFINSSNTSNFMTGVLWDTSDGNVQYNGTQDIVIVTQVNKGQQGKYGIVDYEVKVPSTLDNYKLGSGTVTFYTEVQ